MNFNFQRIMIDICFSLLLLFSCVFARYVCRAWCAIYPYRDAAVRVHLHRSIDIHIGERLIICRLSLTHTHTTFRNIALDKRTTKNCIVPIHTFVYFDCPNVFTFKSLFAVVWLRWHVERNKTNFLLCLFFSFQLFFFWLLSAAHHCHRLLNSTTDDRKKNNSLSCDAAQNWKKNADSSAARQYFQTKF